MSTTAPRTGYKYTVITHLGQMRFHHQVEVQAFLGSMIQVIDEDGAGWVQAQLANCVLAYAAGSDRIQRISR
jgi:hypothetical protein